MVFHYLLNIHRSLGPSLGGKKAKEIKFISFLLYLEKKFPYNNSLLITQNKIVKL